MLRSMGDWMYLSPFALIYAIGTAQVSRFYHPMRHLRPYQVPDWMRYTYALHAQVLAAAFAIQLLVKSGWSKDALISGLGDWMDLPVIGWVVAASTILLFLTPLNTIYTICYVRGIRAEAEFRGGIFAYPGG